MSEIEKMYEKVGLASHLCKYPRFCDDNNCNECPNYSSEFTAEKQIELIKWLMAKAKDYQYDVENGKYWFIIDDYRETKYREFDEALAELINLYWQDLTEQERTEIAEILRG